MIVIVLPEGTNRRAPKLSTRGGKADNERMSSRLSVFPSVSAIVLVCCSVALFAAKEFVKPTAEPASTYPSHDSHPTEKVTAAVEVYNAPPKSDIFSTNFVQDGILPVFLIITNDGDRPIAVNNMRAQLVTTRRAKLEALDADDIMRRIGHVSGASNPHPVGPISIPGHGPKNKKAQQQNDEISRAMFTAAAVEPHSTQSGFLFFDVEDVKDYVAGSHVYLTGLRDSSGNEMMYYDISVIPSNAAVQ